MLLNCDAKIGRVQVALSDQEAAILDGLRLRQTTALRDILFTSWESRDFSVHPIGDRKA